MTKLESEVTVKVIVLDGLQVTTTEVALANTIEIIELASIYPVLAAVNEPNLTSDFMIMQ